MKDTVKSLIFLTTMMKSIPTQVDSDFMREFKRGFKTKSIRDIAARGGIKIKGQENKLLEKSAQIAQAFIESHRIYSSKQKGGGGNSPNILHVLKQASSMGVKSCAILGYSGGKSKSLADLSIHFPVDDMQIAEDMQLVVGHMLMKWLYQNRPDV